VPAAVLHVLERFYDAVPRPVADEHVVGPFSLFVATLAWVHEMTPALLGAARAAGMRVLEQPLLVIDGPVRGEPVQGVKVSILDPDDPRFSGARAAVAAGFEGTGVVSIEPVEQWIAARVRDGLMRVVGAFAGQVPVGGGTHQRRSEVSELTGIATLPSWRHRGVGASITRALVNDAVIDGAHTVFLTAGDDAVARVYERVGFVPVGTACVAEAD